MANCDILVSVLTPTYNRGVLLSKLYDSLLKQTNFSFEWIIVDDGSTDNTVDIVKSFSTNEFDIKVLKKENGGKHTAINFGINECSGLYTFIVDSDDWLTSDAIEQIFVYHKEFGERQTLCGFSFLRMFPDGKINVSSGRKEPFLSSYNKVRVLEKRNGDMAEVYKTSVLKHYPFPVFKKEKFLGEDIVWVEIGKNYDLCFIDYPIYISDYLSDGLTKNRRKNNLLSCNGSYERAKKMLEIRLPFSTKLKSVMQVLVYGKLLSKRFKSICSECKCGFYAVILYLPSLILYCKWKKIRTAKVDK